MKTRIFSIIILSVLILGCNKENVTEQNRINLYANFTVNDTLARVKDQIAFQSVGDTAKNYFWDFGDGSISNERNPKHAYQLPGTYNVKLRIIDEQETTDSISKQIRIGEWFVYKIVLTQLAESNMEASTNPDIYFEIKQKDGEVSYRSELEQNFESSSLPLSFLVPDIKIEPWYLNYDEASIIINLNKKEGDKVENIMTSYDYGSTDFKYDRQNYKGEFTKHAGASFQVFYKVK